jgi:ABC-type multidrug transport system ATPase subunit
MIVKGCSGFASPGIATYIMGSSGAGKTSLLNILSDRVALINKATLSGTITFNDDIPVNQETFARYAAYVMQDDILFSHFTVVEALTFSARLKLQTTHEEQDADVIRIIQELGLFHVKDSQIGDIRRKILSGGERKRTSIGVELVSDPSLIMLDEPTSGLDSFKARSICKLLHDLARKKGRTIVSTIH